MATLVIGLGNKGGEYRWTRHNVGWRCLDVLQARGRFTRERREGPARVVEGSVEGFDVVLARPQTYMNLSGRAGVHLARRYGTPVAEVVVVHDDIDLRLGTVRLKRGGGHAGNNGVRSLVESWRTPDFIRVRIGVGRPPAGVDPADHVLTGFDPEERPVVDAAVDRAAGAVVLLLRVGLEQAMNDVNRREAATPAARPDPA